MPAYVVVTREKTRDAAEIEQYKHLTPPSFKEHPAIIRARPTLRLPRVNGFWASREVVSLRSSSALGPAASQAAVCSRKSTLAR
jgi:hypothetical protein